MRGIEAISGVGLELPIISTSVISGNDPYGRQILGIAGFMGIGLFRPGYWKYGNAPDLEARLAEVQREVFGLASIARAYNVAMAVHNAAGDSVGAGLWDMSGILRGIDPRWVGYDFDPGYATETGGVAGAGIATRLAMPKLKAVTVRDFTWNKDGGVGRRRRARWVKGWWTGVSFRSAGAGALRGADYDRSPLRIEGRIERLPPRSGIRAQADRLGLHILREVQLS